MYSNLTGKVKILAIGEIHDRDNLSHMNFFGRGISEEGRLCTSEEQLKVRQLISSVQPVMDKHSETEETSSRSRIEIYLLDGNHIEITVVGHSHVQIVDPFGYKQVVEQPEIRAILDQLSNPD